MKIKICLFVDEDFNAAIPIPQTKNIRMIAMIIVKNKFKSLFWLKFNIRVGRAAIKKNL